LITGDGRLQVLFKGMVQHEINWETGADGFSTWFKNWKHKLAPR
jgi:hypothetical protein